MTEFHAALDIEPGMQEAMFSLGWTYALQNNRDEARRYLKRYVDAAQGTAPAHYLKAAQDRLTQLMSYRLGNSNCPIWKH